MIEAKARGQGPTPKASAQAKDYAEKLQARFAYLHQRPAHLPHRHGDRRGGLCRALSDAGRTLGRDLPEAERLARPLRRRALRGKGGKWEPRYYQHNAIENALEAIAAGKQRILLTLATGTGKTSIAFQIAWKLFQSRWNLSRRAERAARASCFSPTATFSPIRPTTLSRPFAEDALVRIKPGRNPQEGPRAEERQRVLHDLPDLHERHAMRTASPRPISATIRRTSSTSSSSTNAIAAAPTTKATGAAFSSISRRPCSSA